MCVSTLSDVNDKLMFFLKNTMSFGGTANPMKSHHAKGSERRCRAVSAVTDYCSALIGIRQQLKEGLHDMSEMKYGLLQHTSLSLLPPSRDL